MKKIGLLIIGMLIIVAFCGKKGDDSLEKEVNRKNKHFWKKQKKIIASILKYMTEF